METQQRRPSVLVVDDDYLIRRSVAEILEMEGYPVTTAGDGDRALAMIERDEPSVVLIDSCMPLLDGLRVVREVKRRGLRSRCLVMSGLPDVLRRSAEAGADGCIPKPFDVGAMLALVHEHHNLSAA